MPPELHVGHLNQEVFLYTLQIAHSLGQYYDCLKVEAEEPRNYCFSVSRDWKCSSSPSRNRWIFSYHLNYSYPSVGTGELSILQAHHC